AVERVVPAGVEPARHALRELVQGPTRAERALGLRTAIRPGVRLRSLRAEREAWVASFSRSFLAAGAPRTVTTRLAQLVATLAPLGLQEHVVVATEGRLATTLPLDRKPRAWRPVTGEQDYRYAVRGVQRRLALLGYLDPADVTGELDYRTEQALLAFQGWEGLARTATVTGETQVALTRAKQPRPSARRPGRRVEIHRALGVVLLVEDGRLVRAIHTSTGPTTPAGEFRVTRKERLSWSVPFRVWMPFASYFVRGIALHEYTDVPSYPASHGCVRLPAGEAERVYRFVEVGTPVRVY
ncbi:MAG TPA: L,D-transpeptidase family protein, partial [Gaiellaceae bacterium]|nr:L,D-transpeptidase family protein [Gaiellaceae bacterium]